MSGQLNGGPSGGRRERDSLSALRAEVQRMRLGLERMDAELERLNRRTDGGGPAERSRPERYYNMLLALYERGPHGMSAAEFGALASQFGYDPRGVGGYFTGTNAPLRRESERVLLTYNGRRLVDEHLQRGADADD